MKLIRIFSVCLLAFNCDTFAATAVFNDENRLPLVNGSCADREHKKRGRENAASDAADAKKANVEEEVVTRARSYAFSE